MKCLNGRKAKWEVVHTDGTRIKDEEFGRLSHLFSARREADGFVKRWNADPDLASKSVMVIPFKE